MTDFRRVPSAAHDIFTDDNVYVKIGALSNSEIDLMKLMYPASFVEVIPYDTNRALVTKKLGVTSNPAQFSEKMLHSWLREAERVWNSPPPASVGFLSVSHEIAELHEMISKLPVMYNRRVLPLVQLLEQGAVPIWPESSNRLLHGDLNFRNVVFDGTDQASLIDFDHVTIGPREWDIANMIMVCQIAERTDLIEGIYTFISDWSKPELLTYFLRIRYAQTLVHAAAHIDFETVAGFERRIKLIHRLLALRTSEGL